MDGEPPAPPVPGADCGIHRTSVALVSEEADRPDLLLMDDGSYRMRARLEKGAGWIGSIEREEPGGEAGADSAPLRDRILVRVHRSDLVFTFDDVPANCFEALRRLYGAGATDRIEPAHADRVRDADEPPG